MSVTVTQSPTTPNAAYTRLVYVASGSVTTSEPQYQYVMDVYESGSIELITRITQVPNPAGVAVFDPSPILQGQLQNDNNWKVTGAASPTGSVKTFDIRFGEQYGTSTSSSVTVYTGSTANYLEVFPGIINPNNGISYNFIPDNINDVLTNMPLGLDDPDVTSDVDRVKFVNKTDYHTVTVREAQTVPISIFDRDSALLGTGSIPVGDFGTLGIGPKNLLDYGGALSSSVANPLADLIYANIGTNPNVLYELSIVPAHNDSPCDYENYVRFAWINRYGFWDYYNVYNPVRTNTTLERESFNNSFVNYSTQLSPYNANRRGDTQTYLASTDRYSIDTEYINKEVANWLEELMESPTVYLQEGDNFVPIIVTNTEYRANNSTARNKLFKYTIEWEYANARRSRI